MIYVINSSDNYFTSNPFEPYVYHAYYSAVYSPDKTEEYCLSFDRKGRITQVTHGDQASWYMLGHVYFDKKFSQKFVDILKAEYHLPITKEQLWEDLYIRHITELDMSIRKYNSDTIKEFDSLDELREFDDHYMYDSNSPILKNICKVLNCQENEITHIKPLKIGMTNLSFTFMCHNKCYVYRHPGIGTNTYINRESEYASMEIAKKLKLDNTYIYMNPTEGWKISHFIPNANTLDYHDKIQVKKALTLIRNLHTSGLTTNYTFDIWAQLEKFTSILKEKERFNFKGSVDLQKLIHHLHQLVDEDRMPSCLCHCDCYQPNFLIDEQDNISLIDWEYSGMADPAVDLGTFITCSDYDLIQAQEIIQTYLQGKSSKAHIRHFLAYVSILSYYWFLWSLYQDSMGKTTG